MIRHLLTIVVLGTLAMGCGATAPSSQPSATLTLPTTSLPPTSFTFSGATMSGTATACTKADVASDVPLTLDFSGTARDQAYEVIIGGTDVVAGTTALTPGSAVGVTFIRKSDETFWAAPLKTAEGGAGGSIMLTLTDLDASGQVDAVVVQEAQGVPTPAGTTIHLTGTFGCAFR